MRGEPHAAPRLPRVELVVATLAHLIAYRRSPAALGELLGSAIPEGWPEFPEAIDFTISALEGRVEPPRWSMRFFLDADGGRLVGSGGYAFAPRDRTTEIGYEIAPAYRGRGFATAAARELVRGAFDSGEVDTVLAHTLAQDSPSTGVLARLGFARVAEQPDPEVGSVWEWRLDRPAHPRSVHT